MADENAYLQYEDGLVLHNGLPVKWVTAASAFGDWRDFDIIIERNNCELPNFSADYVGFSVPIYNGQGPWRNTPAYMTEASAYWGTDIRNHNGTVQMKTSKGKRCDIITKYGNNHTTGSQHASDPITRTDPKIPSEIMTTAAVGYLYPSTAVASNHYYFGVKFYNNYGTPTAPDLTNHGNPEGWAAIHKLYAPNATTLDYCMNASNYTAFRNVYAPNVTSNFSAGDYNKGSPRRGRKYDEEYTYSGSYPPFLIENWNTPGLPFPAEDETIPNESSAINVTAYNFIASRMHVKNVNVKNNLSLNNCSASGNFRFRDSVYTSAMFKNSDLTNVNTTASLFQVSGGNVNNVKVSAFSAICRNAQIDTIDFKQSLSAYIYNCSSNGLIEANSARISSGAYNEISADSIYVNSGYFTGNRIEANTITAYSQTSNCVYAIKTSGSFSGGNYNVSAGDEFSRIYCREVKNVNVSSNYIENVVNSGHVAYAAFSPWAQSANNGSASFTGTYHLSDTQTIRFPNNYTGTVDFSNVDFIGSAVSTLINVSTGAKIKLPISAQSRLNASLSSYYSNSGQGTIEWV